MGGLKSFDRRLKKEIAGIFLIAMSILLIICLINPSVGIIAYLLEKALKFLVGIGRFVIPAAAFYLGFQLIRGNSGNVNRLKGWVILYIVFLILMNIFTLRALLWKDIFNGNGGGFLGAALYTALEKSFGYVGSIVILTAFAFVGAILCTNLSLRVFFKKTAAARKRVSNAVINFLFEEIPEDEDSHGYKQFESNYNKNDTI